MSLYLARCCVASLVLLVATRAHTVGIFRFSDKYSFTQRAQSEDAENSRGLNARMLERCADVSLWQPVPQYCGRSGPNYRDRGWVVFALIVLFYSRLLG